MIRHPRTRRRRGGGARGQREKAPAPEDFDAYWRERVHWRIRSRVLMLFGGVGAPPAAARRRLLLRASFGPRPSLRCSRLAGFRGRWREEGRKLFWRELDALLGSTKVEEARELLAGAGVGICQVPSTLAIF